MMSLTQKTGVVPARPFLLLLALLLTGCYNTPVKHLASDIALIKVGESTREDVLIFMGEPDEIIEHDNGVVQWLYRDQKDTFLERMPVVGNKMGTPEEIQAVVVFNGNIVKSREYTSSDEDDMKWSEDFSWQKARN